MTSGTKLLVVALRDRVMLLRRPDSLAEALAGATVGTYGDAEGHVRVERATWS